MDIINSLKDLSSSFKSDELKESQKELSKTSFWDKISQICLLAAIFLTPIFFLPITLSPLYLNKQVFLIILTLIIFIVWLFKFITKGKVILPFGLLFFSLSALILGLVISSYFSISFLDAIRIEAQPSSLILMAVLILFAFFLASEIIGGLDIKKPFFLTILSIALIALISLFQIFGLFILPFDFARNSSFNFAGSHNAFGFLAAGILISLAAYLTFGSNLTKRIRIIFSAIFAILFLYLILINYQIIWYLLALFGIILIVIYFILRKEDLFHFRSLALVILICVVSIFFIIIKNPFIGPQLAIEVFPSQSATFSVLRETLGAGILRLIFGSGSATFSYDWDLYKPQSINETAFWNSKFFGGYSMVLTYLIENGILGGLIFLFFIISLIACGFKLLKVVKEKIVSDEKVLILFSCLIVALFLFVSWFLYPPSFAVNLIFFIFLGILWGGLVSYHQKCQKVLKFSSRLNYAIISTLILIFLIVLGFSGLYFEGQRYAAAVFFGKGQLALNLKGDLDSAINYVSKSIQLDRYEDVYYRSLSQMLLLKLNQNIIRGDNSNLQAIIASAVDTAKQASQKNSQEYLNWMNLGNIYENLIPIVNDAESFANNSYLEAQKRNPKNPEIQLAIARSKIVNFDKIKNQAGLETLRKTLLTQAEKNIDQAISLKSNYSQAYILKSQIYDRKGEIEKALAEIKKAQMIVPDDSVLYFQAGFYNYKLKRYDAAKAEFLTAVSLNENYSNARYFLGLIFDREGRKSAAIEQFEIIEKFNPQNQEVKTILKNLRAGKSALSGISAEISEEPVEKEKTKKSK